MGGMKIIVGGYRSVCPSLQILEIGVHWPEWQWCARGELQVGGTASKWAFFGYMICFVSRLPESWSEVAFSSTWGNQHMLWVGFEVSRRDSCVVLPWLIRYDEGHATSWRHSQLGVQDGHCGNMSSKGWVWLALRSSSTPCRLRNESPLAPPHILRHFAPFCLMPCMSLIPKYPSLLKFEDTQMFSLLKIEVPLISRDSKKLIESHIEAP